MNIQFKAYNCRKKIKYSIVLVVLVPGIMRNILVMNRIKS